MKSYIIIFLFTLVNLLLILSDVYLSIEIEYNKFTNVNKLCLKNYV